MLLMLRGRVGLAFAHEGGMTQWHLLKLLQVSVDFNSFVAIEEAACQM